MLEISIATDADSWYVSHADSLAEALRARGHHVVIVHSPKDLPRGDVALLLSLGQLVQAEDLAKNEHNVVVHASALPAGKGWSPMTWQVIQGKRSIPFTLFEAVAHLDAGPIYLQTTMETSGNELVDELREKQAATTNRMCLEFVDTYPEIVAGAKPQSADGETFYRRRSPDDSELDPRRSIAEQFDLIRTSDPDRYPAFFTFRGRRYELMLRATGTDIGDC